MESEPAITYKLQNHVARIQLNCPDKGNVVNSENLNLMHQYLVKSAANKECRVVIIQGKNGIFSRGMDFNYLLQSQTDKEITTNFSQPYIETVMKIRNFPKPMIAAVDGETLAGGMGIILACDIVIATQRSVFGLSEVLFGLIPAYVFPFLLERVSFKRARYLVLSSQKINAAKAYEFGITDETVADTDLEKTLKQYIKRLLASSPQALEITKTYSDKIFTENIEQAVKSAGLQLTGLLNKKENIDAIKGFINGNMMPWYVKYKEK